MALTAFNCDCIYNQTGKYQRVLFGFTVNGVFSTKLAVLFGFHTVSMLLFVLSGSIVAILTLCAFQCYHFSHPVPPPRI